MIINFAWSQEKLDLYPAGIPNVKKDVDLGENVTALYLHRPDKESKPITFLVIPGGGYAGVAIKHEGHDVAKALADLGYHAYVLRYRLPNSTQMDDKRIGPIQDAQAALLYIREHSEKLGIPIAKIGVLGFSAGGHLASTVSTHYTHDYLDRGVDSSLLRPDFSVLLYPVISMDDAITHKGSKNNLIGPIALSEDVQRFSNDLNVTKNTPPTFIMHAVDDKVVPIANAERYLKALQDHGVEAEYFEYETGGHGFGMINKTDERSWFAEMISWVEELE